jgi:hypothetical protein
MRVGNSKRINKNNMFAYCMSIAEYCRNIKERVETTGKPVYGGVDNNCMQVAAHAMKESYTWN